MKSKSKSMSAKWARAMLAGLLLGAGLAQATPVCAPTYSIDSVNSVVTLAANCTPDPSQSIDFGLGYAWEMDAGGAVAGNPTTGLITQTTAQAGTHSYAVQAKNVSGGGYGVLSAPITVNLSSPTPCSLKVLIADDVPTTTATVNQGASATLVPACLGADTLEWYSKVGNSPYTHILPPPGGVVFPLAATTKYYVVGSNDYGDTASAEVTVNTVAPLAGCTITPASASKTFGDTAGQLFTATCSGGTPTTYAWTLDGGSVGGNSSSYTTVAGLTAITHTVGLTAGNAGGSSSSASATLTVSSVALPSGCAISPMAPSKVTGATNQQFTATCSGGTPTDYVWKVDGLTIAGATSNTYTTAADLALGPHPVAFTASNAGGSSALVTTDLTVSSQPKSACTSISPAAPSVTVGNASPLLTATCDNTPTGYVWKLDGVALNCTGSTCTVPAASLPATTTYNVTVTADNAGGGVGTQSASATITVNPVPVGGGNDRCAANGVVRKNNLTAMNWGTGVPKAGLILKANEAYVWSFAPVGGGKIQTLYSGANKIITISRDMCGFDTPVDGSASCTVQQNTATRTTEVGPKYAPTPTLGYCTLTAGQTYYVNVRNAVSGSSSLCTNTAGCSFYIQY